MKSMWVVACMLVSWDCAEKAMSIQPQRLFAADLVWLWWLPVAIWFVIAVLTATTKYEPA